MNNDPRNRGQRRPSGNLSPRQNVPRSRPTPLKSPAEENELLEFFRELFDSDNMKDRLAFIKAKLKFLLGNLISNIFLAKERIICGVVTGAILIFLALLQTTLFSTIKPFGSVPDLMLSFTLALSVTEGRRWGAVWGIVAAIVIESLNVPSVYLLHLLYMFVGYFGGVICRHFLTESFAVRAVLAVSVLPFKGVFTAVYAVMSPLYVTAGEIFFDIVLPEAAATLLLAMPVHILVYLCMKPFHHTRAEMVSER